MSALKSLSSLGATAALILGGTLAVTAPAAAAPAAPEQVRSSCTTSVVGATGRVQCTLTSPHSGYRARAVCGTPGGTTYNEYGPVRSSGWSVANCSPNTVVSVHPQLFV
ncbi:hypothetical protein [Streptomyces sp. CAU 1734]|uniref:hypothetical protein n=1 Tax=Streptomyces sp. CAU 1734 TaxID=3140360 RepID=UPI0032606CEF